MDTEMIVIKMSLRHEHVLLTDQIKKKKNRSGNSSIPSYMQKSKMYQRTYQMQLVLHTP